MKNFKDKVCVITGAASGIGRALAMRLGDEGARLVICDIRSDMLAETKKLITQKGGQAETHIVDVSDRDAVFALAAHVDDQFGGADLVVNNAGVAQIAAIHDLSLDDFKWVMDINFWGVVHGTQAFLPQMRRRDTGHIANVSSIFGLISVPRQAAYNSAKFAVLGFTDAVRHDLQNTNINTTCIHPGGINTNIVRHARFLQSADMEREREEAITSFAKITMTEPDKAARIILNAIRKRKVRVRVGADAILVDIARRLFPVHYLRFIPFFGNNNDAI